MTETERQGGGMRVTCVVHGGETFGVRRAVLSLIDGLSQAGAHVRVASLAPGPFRTELAERGTLVDICGDVAVRSLNGNLGRRAAQYVALRAESSVARPALCAAVRSHQADLIHFVWPNHLFLVGRVARALRLPATWEQINLVGAYPFGLNRRLMLREVRRSNIAVLAPSEYIARSLCPDERRAKCVRVLPLGVDIEQFDPGQVVPRSRAECGIPEKAIVVGMVARIHESKGQVQLIRALSSSLLPSELHVVLVGGGNPSAMALVKETARRAGVEDRVHVLGDLPDPERYFGIMDMTANLRQDAEPYGLAVVESMAMQRPVMVHALGGPAETVIDGRTGWHLAGAPGPRAIRDGLIRALAVRPRWPSMGRAARAHVVERYTLQQHTEGYLAATAALLSRGGNRPLRLPGTG